MSIFISRQTFERIKAACKREGQPMLPGMVVLPDTWHECRWWHWRHRRAHRRFDREMDESLRRMMAKPLDGP